MRLKSRKGRPFDSVVDCELFVWLVGWLVDAGGGAGNLGLSRLYQAVTKVNLVFYGERGVCATAMVW